MTAFTGAGVAQPEWHVDVEGCTNFRDAGGWMRPDGTRMRRGLLYRADDPLRLTAAGRSAVDALGLELVVDLRQAAQVARGPGFLPPSRTVHVQLVDRVVDVENPRPLRTPGDVADLYEEMIGGGAPALGRALDLVAEHVGSGPVLVHCVYGKDRAGLLVALIQAGIGMPAEVIAAEYARSDGPTRRRREWMLADPRPGDPPAAKAPPFLFTAPSAVMADLLDRATARHGSLTGWVEALPIARDTTTRLRRALLEA